MNYKRGQDNISPLNHGLGSPALGGERRGHKRHTSHQIKLTFLGADHVAINWTQDGVLIVDRHPRVEIGTRIEGVLTVGSVEGRFKFAAELVRRDKRTHEAALRFINPSHALLEVLTQLTE